MNMKFVVFGLVVFGCVVLVLGQVFVVMLNGILQVNQVVGGLVVEVDQVCWVCNFWGCCFWCLNYYGGYGYYGGLCCFYGLCLWGWGYCYYWWCW